MIKEAIDHHEYSSYLSLFSHILATSAIPLHLKNRRLQWLTSTISKKRSPKAILTPCYRGFRQESTNQLVRFLNLQQQQLIP